MSVLARRSSKYASIHDAVKNGDVKELEVMFKEGASLNEIDATRHRFTPLHWACHVGALEVCFYILLKSQTCPCLYNFERFARLLVLALVALAQS